MELTLLFPGARYETRYYETTRRVETYAGHTCVYTVAACGKGDKA